MSPSTIDRYLRPRKDKIKRRLYGRTKPGTLLRHQIPVKYDHWDAKQPGFLEMDLVSHSGECSSGDFIYTLNLTDIASAWVENRAVVTGKGEQGVQDALQTISETLPFKILGIDSDNGSEFINWSFDLPDKRKLLELKTLRDHLDPFELSERITQKLEQVWTYAHHRWKPLEAARKTTDELKDLSASERKTMEALSQIFVVRLYVRTRKGGELVRVDHG